MIKRYLNDYKNFKCIAGDCPATCCSGWAIEIDEDSLSSYQAYSGPDADYLKRNIDWKESIFKQQANGDCAFLNADGLCRMYKNMGEEHLCMTCDLYPRHMEEFPGVREYSLSVSCPVAAKQLIEQSSPLSFTVEEDNLEEDTYEDFNEPLYHLLTIYRERVLEILKNRSVSYNTRAAAVISLMRKAQEKIDEGDMIDPVFSGPIKYPSVSAPFETASKDLFLLLYELEPLRSEFRTFTVYAESVLFEENSLDNLEKAFEEKHPDWEIYCEQIAYYFIFTYMCGAVYDDYVFSMACQAIYNAYMIKLLWIAKWNNAETPLDSTELSTILYQYSRELEHSTDNMILLEQLLDEL